ncbi:MAG: hypothetical protein QXU31_06390 [Archaeoglobaceae archaeon]
MMGIMDMFKKNPLEKLSMRELQGEELRLRNKLDRIKKDVNEIEKKKKQLFQEGVGADFLKKKMIAQEMKSLDLEQKLRMKDFMTAQRQHTLIKNLVIVKRYQRELESQGIWKKLTSIDPEKLENALININLDGKAFDSILDDLNRVFEMRLADESLKEDPAEKELMEAWAKVESGESPEKIFDEVKKKIEKEEEI